MKRTFIFAIWIAWILMSLRYFGQGGMDVGSYWICVFLFIIGNVIIYKEDCNE